LRVGKWVLLFPSGLSGYLWKKDNWKEGMDLAGLSCSSGGKGELA
jgi:hypothetical protein